MPNDTFFNLNQTFYWLVVFTKEAAKSWMVNPLLR